LTSRTERLCRHHRPGGSGPGVQGRIRAWTGPLQPDAGPLASIGDLENDLDTAADRAQDRGLVAL